MFIRLTGRNPCLGSGYSRRGRCEIKEHDRFNQDLIKSRRSVRTFDGNKLSREDREKLYVAVLGLEEQGIKPEVVINDPGIRLPEGVEYIASVE